MSKNTSITLGEHFDAFIQGRIEDGRYRNASEVIRAGLRLLETKEEHVQALRIAIEQGERSGIAEDFDSKMHLKKLKAQANG